MWTWPLILDKKAKVAEIRDYSHLSSVEKGVEELLKLSSFWLWLPPSSSPLPPPSLLYV